MHLFYGVLIIVNITPLMKKDANEKMCSRCNSYPTTEIICQSCKNELLSNYEASLDWCTAYEIERSQLIASKYKCDENDEMDFNGLYSEIQL
jgi:hypothetical protein